PNQVMKKWILVLLGVVVLLTAAYYCYFGLFRGEQFYRGLPISCRSSAELVDLVCNEDKRVSTPALVALVAPDAAWSGRAGPQPRALTMGEQRDIRLILQTKSPNIPRDDSYNLAMIDVAGNILDRISVSVSNRLTNEDRFCCDVVRAGEHDGA